ncbi:MAG: hypothetical protein IJC48_02030 [Clostridia bacterium]|nr:hypothetical protein [Clostridia bacterium]
MITIKKHIGKFLILTVFVLTSVFSGSVPALASEVPSFVVGLVSAEGAALNPLVCNQRDLININELVFESVIDFDDELKPTGELALSWTVEESVFTFKLRDNVRFHDGTYLSAQDVYETYQRILALGDNGSPYYSRCQYIKSMEVTDLYTLKVTGKYESLLTLYAMTFPVLQRNSVTWETAVGTGPYWYMNYELDWLRVDANPYWWKKAPVIQSIYGYRYNETGDALKALSTGEIDAMATRSQSAALGRLLSDRTSVDYTTLTYEMLIPNIDTVQFASVKTRQALMYAIDITGIASNIYMDMVTEAEVPVVPGSWLYEPQSAVYFESKERAMQLLYEAGWGDFNGDGILDQVVDGVLEQLDFTLITYIDDTAATRTHAAEMIRDQLRPLGINVTVETLSLSAVQKRLANHDFDLALCAVNMSLLPDLTFLLASDGRMNYSQYEDGGMKNFLTAIYETTDETQFKILFSQMQLKIAEELPFLGLFFRKGTFMTTSTVTGLGAVRETDALRGIEYIEFLD